MFILTFLLEAAKKLAEKHASKIIFYGGIQIEQQMLRATVKSLNLSNRICNQTNFNISHSELCVQSVRRWRYRRPLELGTSKSKLFRIPEHPEQDPEERAELTRLATIYK